MENAEQGPSQLSIMVIDDEPDILSIFTRSLEMSGYSTNGFDDPVAAVEHFRQNPKTYDIVITDIRMPGMNGFQVIRAVRKVNPDVKVILTSSFEIAMKEFNVVLPSLAVDGVIEKPVTLEKLGEVVKSIGRNDRVK